MLRASRPQEDLDGRVALIRGIVRKKGEGIWRTKRQGVSTATQPKGWGLGALGTIVFGRHDLGHEREKNESKGMPDLTSMALYMAIAAKSPSSDKPSGGEETKRKSSGMSKKSLRVNTIGGRGISAK